jgi:hypothetical protein
MRQGIVGAHPIDHERAPRIGGHEPVDRDRVGRLIGDDTGTGRDQPLGGRYLGRRHFRVIVRLGGHLEDREDNERGGGGDHGGRPQPPGPARVPSASAGHANAVITSAQVPRANQLRKVGQAEHLLEPVSLRDPDSVGAEQLGGDHAAPEGHGRAERERQNGYAESEHDPGSVASRLTRAARDQNQDHHDRQDGPDLDHRGEAEEHAAE